MRRRAGASRRASGGRSAAMASSLLSRAGRVRVALVGVGLLCAAALDIGAARADYIEHVTAKISQVYVKNNRARVVLNVFNGNNDVLDIEVTCNFFASDKKPAGSGHNTVPRLAPRRGDTLEVTDEMAALAVNIDSASCS